MVNIHPLKGFWLPDQKSYQTFVSITDKLKELKTVEEEKLAFPLPPSSLYAIYCYRQSRIEEKTEHIFREGIIVSTSLSSHEKNLYPHEKADLETIKFHLRILEETSCFITPVHTLSSIPDAFIEKKIEESIKNPIAIIKSEDDITHTISAIHDFSVMEKIIESICHQKLVIADGHHRFYAALEYLKLHHVPVEIPIFIENTLKNNFPIKSFHRGISLEHPEKITSLITDLGKNYRIKSLLKEDVENFKLQFRDQQYIIQHLTNDTLSVLQKAEMMTSLDGWMEQDGLMKERTFETDSNDSLQKLAKGYYDVLLYFPDWKMSDIYEMAINNSILPVKSTYFYPKVLPGIVMSQLNGNSVEFKCF